MGLTEWEMSGLRDGRVCLNERSVDLIEWEMSGFESEISE